MIDDERIDIEKRVRAYHEKVLPVHIETKEEIYLNGYIKEVGSEFFIFYDRFDGEVLIFFRDIRKIHQFVGDASTLKKVKK